MIFTRYLNIIIISIINHKFNTLNKSLWVIGVNPLKNKLNLLNTLVFINYVIISAKCNIVSKSRKINVSNIWNNFIFN